MVHGGTSDGRRVGARVVRVVDAEEGRWGSTHSELILGVTPLLIGCRVDSVGWSELRRVGGGKGGSSESEVMAGRRKVGGALGSTLCETDRVTTVLQECMNKCTLVCIIVATLSLVLLQARQPLVRFQLRNDLVRGR